MCPWPSCSGELLGEYFADIGGALCLDVVQLRPAESLDNPVHLAG